MPDTGTTPVVVSLGSNMGDRLAVLRRAMRRLEDLGRVSAVSPLYETDPVGPVEQAPFYNAVAVVETRLGAEDLLRRMLEIEAELGRVRGRRRGPRTIDLDLILHGHTVIRTADVTVPHPRYRQRRFVLEPLVAVRSDARDPDGTRAADMLSSVADQRVTLVEGPGWCSWTGHRDFPPGGLPDPPERSGF